MELKLRIEILTDTSLLSGFECGVPMMDEFLHTTFFESVSNHYCNAYAVWSDRKIVAVFALSFDSLVLDVDDLNEILSGMSATSMPEISNAYQDVFQCKRHYPALEITYLAVAKEYRNRHIGRDIVRYIARRAQKQDLAGCQFLTVEALKTEPYSAVGFYNRCHFAPCEYLNPAKDTWRMFFTLYPKHETKQTE